MSFLDNKAFLVAVCWFTVLQIHTHRSVLLARKELSLHNNNVQKYREIYILSDCFLEHCFYYILNPDHYFISVRMTFK